MYMYMLALWKSTYVYMINCRTQLVFLFQFAENVRGDSGCIAADSVWSLDINGVCDMDTWRDHIFMKAVVKQMGMDEFQNSQKRNVDICSHISDTLW